MRDLIKAVDGLPKLVKLILCIPALDIVWAIYRIVVGVEEKNLVKVAIGVLWIVGACTITWLFDLITTLLYDHPQLT